ncbi:alpha-ketoacid dehydrogenase subunit alpha/beta [Agromyces mariniharenae]|uniref:dihydrolipoyllysine-residue succinyltransferase n=1 Tax=Agromyces mariniharenae TaxID=2604423 RepID=A0A5S4VAS4_9MICO|nr:alpha-ketoacid dehydrogenase subunit alpha/beta [Agromyces mariniharenae]TYL54431.1 MFS transporter [Agromyces mariniharenae]
MPSREPLAPGAPWIELRSTEEDWRAADPALLTGMLAELHLIRAFEETVLDLAGAGLVHGPAHSSIGQEGGAVGSIIGLRSTDAVNGSHRGHHQFLAKALTHVTGGRFALDAVVTPDVAEVLRRTLAEILGLAQGYCRGRGGSMHLQWLEAGALGTNAIVGGGVPGAAGSAWAQRHAGTSDTTFTYFGDGAVNIGSVLETMNLASAWDLPLAFFIENNLYAVATRIDEVTRERRLSARGLGFATPAWRVDGMDPLAVHLAASEALDLLRTGGGPVVIEAEVYRYFHQNGPFPGSAFGYRTKDEEQSWRDRDPIARMERELRALGHVGEAEAASVREQAVQAMRETVAQLVEDDPETEGQRRIVPALWPDPSFVDVGIRGDASELAGARVADPAASAGPAADPDAATPEEARFVDAIAAVLDRRMSQDERIVVLGEDIHRLAGGTNGATKGLAAAYPGRVLGTPISENAFAGLAGGLALDGRFRPIVEFMYADFTWVAADQVFNQIGKARHMFGGENPIPLVLRTKVAMGSGYGSQHLMDPAGVFSTSPGWRIVAPSTAADYIGLMNAALALDDPVLVIEHVDLYARRDSVPTGDLDYVLPPGRAAIRREGTEVTVLSYLSMVGHCLEAIEQSGVDAELVDLRWLDFASLDWDTIGASIRKTNNVLIVEQGARGTSYGGRLADELQRRFFDWLDQPIERVTGGEASPSISKVLERAAIARTEEVVAGLERIRVGRGGA